MSILTKYNPMQVPFNPEIAEYHRKASSSGKSTGTQQRCPCCLSLVERSPLPVNFDMDELNHLGNEYRFLYTFTKMIGLSLLLIFFDSGLSQFQDVINHQFPNSTFTSLGLSWSSLSPLYPADKFWLYSLLSFVTLLAVIFLARVFFIYKTRSQTDNKIGQQQWSILLKNIPKSISIEEKIRDLFKRNFDNIGIRQIILISQMQKYDEVNNQIKKQMSAWKKLITDEQKNKNQILISLQKIHASKQKLNAMKEQFLKDKNENFSGNAIIVFQSKENQQEILKAWHSKFFTKSKEQASIGQINLNDRQLIIAEEAPSPSQIDWSNISLLNSSHNAIERLNLILLFLVHAGLYLLYFLSQLCLGRKFGEDFSRNQQTILTLILLSVLSYSVMPWAVKIIQRRQRQQSKTKYSIGLIDKLSFSLLVMKSLIIFAVENTFISGSLVANSTINKIVIFLFVDLFVSQLFWLINPQDIFKRAEKFIATKKNTIIQEDAQRIYQRTSHNIEFKYSFLACSFWMATMLSNLAPIGLVITVVSLFLFFWLDKLNLSRRSRVSNKKISQKFTFEFIFLIEKSLILKPLANLILWSIANQKVGIPEIIMLVFGVVYNFVPKNRIVDKVLQILKFRQKITQHYYDEKLMPTLYKIQNPITGGLKAKLTFVQSQKGIKQQGKKIGGNLAQSITMSEVIQPPKQNFYEKVQELGKHAEPQQTDRNMINQ